MLSICIPVSFLNNLSQLTIEESIRRAANLELEIVIGCSDKDVFDKLCKLCANASNSTIFLKVGISSNQLRKQCLENCKQPWIYYQDADDLVDYSALLSFLLKNKSNNTIYIFNITKYIVKETEDFSSRKIDINFLEGKKIYTLSSGTVIRQIHKLPTNIVNKLIPRNEMLKVDFYNLPFSQDWSLSYQLFLLKEQIFIDLPIYSYLNSSLSEGHMNKTKRYGIRRVKSFQNILTKKFFYKFEIGYLNYRYDLLILSRYISIHEYRISVSKYYIHRILMEGDFILAFKIIAHLIKMNLFLFFKILKRIWE